MSLKTAALSCMVWSAAAGAVDVSVPPDMITVPSGTFIMGSDQGPADERPAHKVDLREFTIDRLPVTNAQFAEFLQYHRNPKQKQGAAVRLR